MFSLNLKGKKAFIAGIGDDQGYGWAIAKALQEAGCTLILGVWTPILNIFKTSLEMGKFDESRKLSNGSLLEFAKIYGMDANFDTMEEVPPEILENKRYKGIPPFAIQDIALEVQKDFGEIDILIHSLANAPEIAKNLLETSRKGYLASLSASSYSFISLLHHFLPLMKEGSSALSLSYRAAFQAMPGYGGGMSSAKAALESDTKTLAFEAGRAKGIRVNSISAGPLRSRAARAIGTGEKKGFIDQMIEYSKTNSPLQKDLEAEEVAACAVFLSSPLASAITGEVIFVDNGLNIMGYALDSRSFEDA